MNSEYLCLCTQRYTHTYHLLGQNKNDCWTCNKKERKSPVVFAKCTHSPLFKCHFGAASTWPFETRTFHLEKYINVAWPSNQGKEGDGKRVCLPLKILLNWRWAVPVQRKQLRLLHYCRLVSPTKEDMGFTNHSNYVSRKRFLSFTGNLKTCAMPIACLSGQWKLSSGYKHGGIGTTCLQEGSTPGESSFFVSQVYNTHTMKGVLCTNNWIQMQKLRIWGNTKRKYLWRHTLHHTHIVSTLLLTYLLLHPIQFLSHNNVYNVQVLVRLL